MIFITGQVHGSERKRKQEKLHIALSVHLMLIPVGHCVILFAIICEFDFVIYLGVRKDTVPSFLSDHKKAEREENVCNYCKT